jgi:hypothetical protein
MLQYNKIVFFGKQISELVGVEIYGCTGAPALVGSLF